MQSEDKHRRWRRAITIALLVAIIGYLFLRAYPRAWSVTCRSVSTHSTDAGGRDATTYSFTCLPIYWYYIFAFAGSWLAAVITLRKITLLRSLLFIILCDLFITWIAGVTLLVWDSLQPHAVPTSAYLWLLLPFLGLWLGGYVGNVVTFGFSLWAGAMALLFAISGEALNRRLGLGSNRPQ